MVTQPVSTRSEQSDSDKWCLATQYQNVCTEGKSSEVFMSLLMLYSELVLELMKLRCGWGQLQWWLAGLSPAYLRTVFGSGKPSVFGCLCDWRMYCWKSFLQHHLNGGCESAYNVAALQGKRSLHFTGDTSNRNKRNNCNFLVSYWLKLGYIWNYIKLL